MQISELEAALAKAVAGLVDEGVRSHIQANLPRCAAALHERLATAQSTDAMEEEEQQPAVQAGQQQQEQQQGNVAKRVKRGRKAAAATGPGAEAPAEEAEQLEDEAAELPTLATAAGYAALVAGQVAGRPDARFSPASLLLARRLPGEELLRAHVQGVLADAAPEAAGAASAMAAARATLGLCAALAVEAARPEEALHMFGPAVSQLAEVAAQLAGEQAGAAEQGEQAQQAQAGLARELLQLAGRALAAMHAALLQQRLALRSGSVPASGSSYWRANPQSLLPPAAAEAACAAAAAACCLLTDLRLQHDGSRAGDGRSGRQQIQALAAAAAGDLRQLAPYASSGLLAELAGAAQEEVCSSASAARRYLVLYGGAAQQGGLEGEGRGCKGNVWHSLGQRDRARVLGCGAHHPCLVDPSVGCTQVRGWNPLCSCPTLPLCPPPPLQSWWASGTTWPAWWRHARPARRHATWQRRPWQHQSWPKVWGMYLG